MEIDKLNQLRVPLKISWIRAMFCLFVRISPLTIKFRMIPFIILRLILKAAGLFGWSTGFEQLYHRCHPLLKRNQRVNWQQLGQKTLETVGDQEPKSNAGRKPFDVRLRFQTQDRISFLLVLALSLDDTLPETKTICLFRPQLTRQDGAKNFSAWDQFRPQNG